MTFSYLLSRRHSRHRLSSVLSKFTHKKIHWGVTWRGPSPPRDATVLSGQSTKTNKVVSDATIEARVVMSFACAEWCGAALSLTGRWLAVYWGPFRRHQSNDHLSDNYVCSALFVRTACWPIMRYRVNVAVNSVCAWRAVYTWHMYDIVGSLGATIIARSPILRLLSRYRLIDMNPKLQQNMAIFVNHNPGP